jgi:hypothetical protein
MTEADLIEAIAAFNSSAQSWMGLYMSILSAYLIVAYLAGRNLTRSQMTIISICFATFAFLTAYSSVANATRILEFSNELRELNPSRVYAVNSWIIIAVEVLLYGGVIVALKFMWDVRHPKTE